MRSPGPRIISRRIKPVLHACLLLPLVMLIQAVFTGTVGVNPVETMTHVTGEWSLRILLLSLVITPMARITGTGWLLQFRRMIGLYAFFYGMLHFLIYLVFDLSLDFGFLVEEVIERPYITVGFAAFVILIFLAATSTSRSRQKLGKTWVRIHRFVYVAAVLTIVHFLWITRVDDTAPIVYGSILVVLLGYRMMLVLKKRRRSGKARSKSPELIHR